MNHMAESIRKGQVPVSDFLSNEKLKQILAASRAVNSKKLTDVMQVLGDEFTYADVKMALAHQQNSSREEH